MADNYTDLQTQIISWADRANDARFVAQVPDFIDLAEAQFNKKIRVWDMECYLPTPYVPANPTEETLGVYDLPADWGGHVSVELKGDKLWILYYQRIPPLSDSTPSNWLLLKHPDLYLYMSLAQAGGYLKNHRLFPFWKHEAEKALLEVAVLAAEEQRSGSTPVALVPGHRNWKRVIRRPDYTYDWIAPKQYFDLVSSELNFEDVGERKFTVSAQKIRIWPKPAMPA